VEAVSVPVFVGLPVVVPVADLDDVRVFEAVRDGDIVLLELDVALRVKEADTLAVCVAVFDAVEVCEAVIAPVGLPVPVEEAVLDAVERAVPVLLLV